MHCPTCQKTAGKFGKTRDGQQRYRCNECHRTFSEPKPFAGKCTPTEKALPAIKMLLEGMSIRSVERLTGLHRDTIISLMVQAGKQCQLFMAAAAFDHEFADLQLDEQWTFVGCKEKTAYLKGYGPDCGDAYTFIAIDRQSKFIPTFHVGKRDAENTWAFAEQLRTIVRGRPHISTDGFKPYCEAIPGAFRGEVDHGRIVKKYGHQDTNDSRRFSPAAVVGIRRETIFGSPIKHRISTSHVERFNLTARMSMRRYTRLTSGHSKKWSNHVAMTALFVAWYNFVRPHATLKTTPAVAAGITSEAWTLERLLTESAKALAA